MAKKATAKKTLTKKEIVDAIAFKTGKTQEQVKEITQSFFEVIVDNLEKGKRIAFRDFGIFTVKKRNKRVGRNPKTGDVIKIPARNVVTFKVGKALKEKVLKAKIKK